MLKSAPRASFIKLDLMDDFPRITITPGLSTRRGVLYAGPFIGAGGLGRAVDALSRLLGLRTCAGRLAPAGRFSAVYPRPGRQVRDAM